jgi:hypothetical protein
LEGVALGDDDACGAFDLLLQAANRRRRAKRRRFFIEIEL